MAQSKKEKNVPLTTSLIIAFEKPNGEKGTFQWKTHPDQSEFPESKLKTLFAQACKAKGIKAERKGAYMGAFVDGIEQPLLFGKAQKYVITKDATSKEFGIKSKKKTKTPRKKPIIRRR